MSGVTNWGNVWNVAMKCFPNPRYLCLCVQSSIRHSSELVRVWRSFFNTNMHKYFKALGWYSRRCGLFSVSATNLLRAPGHTRPSSLLPKRRINGISVPCDASVTCHTSAPRAPGSAGAAAPKGEGGKLGARNALLEGTQTWNWQGKQPDSQLVSVCQRFKRKSVITQSRPHEVGTRSFLGSHSIPKNSSQI